MSRFFCFNPDSEMAIVNGSPYYTPPANIVRMTEDLAYLPAYFSEAGDALFMQRKPEEVFMRERESIFRLKPEIILPGGYEGLGNRTPEPWGWSPRVDRLLRAAYWKNDYKALYSRLTACRCLEELRDCLPFVEKECLPQVCRSLDEIAACVAGEDCIAKAPWSSSGKGLLGIGKEGITEKSGEWLRGVLNRQGFVMVEKRLERVYDFAMEFYSDGKERIDYLGLSFFYTGTGGEYQGNYIGRQAEIESRLLLCTEQEKLYVVKEELRKVLSVYILPYYKGYLGVDMMIYRDEEGRYRIQPCVEINLRYTMGILALFLSERYVAANSEGIFKISFYPGEGEALQKHLYQRETMPLECQDYKIVSGYINLNPVENSTKFLAELSIGRQ